MTQVPDGWKASLAATSTEAVVVAIDQAVGEDFTDEAARYVHRQTLAAVMRPWFAEHGTDASAVL